MWEFIQIGKHTSDLSVVLKVPRMFTVGRIDADIIIPDKSVSRRHASLEVQAAQNGGLAFILCDHSKFGTFVNGTPLNGSKRILKKGDKVTFGVQPGVNFSLQETVLNIAVSSMNKAERQRIKAITNLLHGELVPTCTDACAFLVMPHLVVTVKVVCALLAMVPIVTPLYMEKFLEAASCIPFVRPNFENFLPPVREERLVDSDAIRFLPNDKRPSLFKGKVFYVLTHAHFSELSPIVRLGGGKVVLIDSSEAFVQHYEEQSGTCGNVERDLQEVLQREGSCVIHAQNAPGLENWQRVVYSVLRGIRRRPILESELGFAVLYISTNGYCNPETKCPEKLYQEAGVSQTLSVNPFHIDSQADGSVLTERSLKPQMAPFRPSLKRPWPLSGSTESSLSDKKVFTTAEMVSSETSGTSSKRLRRCTNIVPPREIPCIPKSKCLVADSETMFHSPGNTEKHHPLSVCSEQSNVNDHTIIQSKNMVKPTELMKENIAPLFRETDKNPADQLISQTSLCHQTENFIDEQDALAALSSMPSLFPLQIPRASVTSTRRGILKDLSPSNEADLSNPDSSTVSADPHPAICNQAELRKLQLSSASSPNSVIQQRTSSPMKATHPSSVGLAGWLSKNAPMTPTDSDNVVEPVVPTHPPIELMDLVVPISIRARRVVKDQLEVGPNYKTFKKVWPVYMSESPVADQTKRSNGHFATARVDLTPFVPDSPRPADIPNEEPACISEQEERARIDRLFHQLCQIPKGRM
ncbi:Nibrin [Clonorchis sinensis]|uniref:Nibrin n=1 Tax=Clonorchis sinensis TaxID=79923 RepID=A0A8T1MJ48_CLOSI|nr:Nibrin [Clonorchis sinensis]